MRKNKWKRLRAGSLPLTHTGRMARKMEQFIKRNGLYQSHYIIENGKKVERFDYYPIVEFKKLEKENQFYLRIRMDGCKCSEQFRDMEELLAHMFSTICVERIEERGYLTYAFELKQGKQMRISSKKDIPYTADDKIVFSDVVWDWKKCPHLLLMGNTGSGKTQLAQYIITCLLAQGVRVVYCDPKNDDDMRLFVRSNPVIRYVTKENEIAKVVRETEEEVRLREMDLNSIGIKDAEFNPVFIIFDELIAFSKIAEKKTYEETTKRLASIVVTGRSKRIYCGMILQRPDTAFVEGAIRDNLGCRICMGQMSDTAYAMAFGKDFADVRNKNRCIGAGMIFQQGIDTKPREFLAPYIEKGALNRD